MIATANSNPIKRVKINKGIKCANHKPVPKVVITHAKPAITFNKVCPAIIFANNRTDKLTTLNT